MVIWLSQPLLLSWLWFTWILISHCQSEKKIPSIVPTDLTCKDQKRQEILQKLTDRRILVRTEVIWWWIDSTWREDVSIHQTNLKYCGKSAKIHFHFYFCSPICSNSCGVVFFVKIYFSFREMTLFVQLLKYEL